MDNVFCMKIFPVNKSYSIPYNNSKCLDANVVIEVILMSTFNIPLFYRRLKKYPLITPIYPWSCAMIKPQWLELPITRTKFDGHSSHRRPTVNQESPESQTFRGPFYFFPCVHKVLDESQTVRTLIRRRHVRRLIRVFTVCTGLSI